MKKFLCFTLPVILTCSTVFGAFVKNENEVPQETNRYFNYNVTTSKLFDNFSISTTLGTITGHGANDFVYVDGGTTTSYGLVDVSNADDLIVTYNVDTLSGGTRTVKFFGKGGSGGWVDTGIALTFTGTTTGIIKIAETGLRFIRAGMNTSVIGTETITITLDARERR